MKTLAIFLLILTIALCAFPQSGKNLQSPPKMDATSSLNVLSATTGQKYATTETVSIATGAIGSFIYYFNWLDFDSSFHRTNVQLHCKFTGGAAANYQPLYFYYKLINYAGTALADSFYINDMISEWWTNSAVYTISLPPINFPAQGIQVFCINTGAATISWVSDIYTSHDAGFSQAFERYSMQDTIRGDTISGTFAVQNLSGLLSIDVTLDSLDKNVTIDSFKFEIRPAWEYSGSSDDTPWITLDSLNWRAMLDGYQRIESITGYLSPCPFIDWRAFLGTGTSTGDTADVTIKQGGYR